MNAELLKNLLCQFQDEVDGVEEYMTCAEQNKDDPELKKMYTDMAAAEYDHASRLLKQWDKKMSEDVVPEEAADILKMFMAAEKEDATCKLAKAKARLDMGK